MTAKPSCLQASEGVRLPLLKPDEELRWASSAASEMPRFNPPFMLSRADAQFVIDALIHARLALDSVQGMRAFDGEEEGEGRVIDNAKTRLAIDCALCRMGVARDVDLPVRAISSCTDRECAGRNSALSKVTP